MERPINPYRRGDIIWSIMEGGLQEEFDGLPGWSDLDREQVAEVFGILPDNVSTYLCRIRKKTGYRVKISKKGNR